MILVTTGTCAAFDRLITHIDKLAPLIEDKIFIQTGESEMKPVNCEFEKYLPSLTGLINNSKLVITHGGLTFLELLKMKKPLVIVPRQKKYKEHFDDHQVELAEYLNKKYKVPYFLDVEELTADFISHYKYISGFDNAQSIFNFQTVIEKVVFS